MRKMTVVIIFLSILLILSVQSISAHELNETQNGSENIVADSQGINVKEVKNTDTNDLKIENENSPGTFQNLQTEINNAKDGSTLDLTRDYNADGTIINLNKDLTIDGHGHTINCLNNAGNKAFKSSTGTIILKNINIINGHDSSGKYGGAIFVTGTAKYTIENCIFDNNMATTGGGTIYSESEYALTIKNCKFTSSTADYGGAIYSTRNVIVENSVFENNHADTDGGAIYSLSTVFVTNCTFKDNYAADYGGAIYANNVRINTNQNNDADINTFFINNRANDNDGGAIYAEGSDYALIIKNSRFTSNTADYGGAINSKSRVVVENSVFENNRADTDGGAIYSLSTVFVTNCTFENNRAEGASTYQCYGGAIRTPGDVVIDSCTFKDNYAADYGGAIYANNVHINTNQNNDADINTFFINNRANDNDGGAIYAEGSVEAFNTEFLRNSALVDGGAIYSSNNVVACHCLFVSNQASGASSNCYGGAIRAKVIAHAVNSVFRGNYAEDRGGAIHATCISLEGENSFESNVAEDYGGAIYTETFIREITNTIFIDNVAKSGDGGAIYVNSECNVVINRCQFINNRCKDDGGAIYLDSSKSHIWLTNNVFYANNADDGQSVYAWGTYEQISSNFWAGNNPSSDNGLLTEYGFFSDTDHADSNPVRLDAIIGWDMDENDKLVFNARIAYFTSNNELYYGIVMVDAEYTIESNGKTIEAENVKIENNQITLNFHPPMGTTVLTIHYGGYTIQKTITIQYAGHMGSDDSSYATLEVRVE